MNSSISKLYHFLTEDGEELKVESVRSYVNHYIDEENEVVILNNTYKRFELVDSNILFARGEGGFNDIASIVLLGDSKREESRARLKSNYLLKKSIFLQKQEDERVLVREELSDILTTERIPEKESVYDFNHKLSNHSRSIISVEEKQAVFKYLLREKKDLVKRLKKYEKEDNIISFRIKLGLALDLNYDESITPGYFAKLLKKKNLF